MTVSELISYLQTMPPDAEAVRLDESASEQPGIVRIDAVSVFMRKADSLDLKCMVGWQLNDNGQYEVVVVGGL